MKRYTFEAALRNARPGETIVYYTGLLLADRGTNPDLQDLARAAWQAYQDGDVCLTQRRLGPYVYEYLATKAFPRGAIPVPPQSQLSELVEAS